MGERNRVTFRDFITGALNTRGDGTGVVDRALGGAMNTTLDALASFASTLVPSGPAEVVGPPNDADRAAGKQIHNY